MILRPKSPLLLATRNCGKVREIQAVLVGLQLEFASLLDFPALPDVEESGTTFRENARLKADYYAARSGLPALADDSGLMVDALEGRPGVLSARFAPTDSERILKLLELMRPFKGTDRRASFACALCLARPPELLEVEESVTGEIALKPVGLNGFGYDPVFCYTPLGKTFAEMTSEEKNSVSHRALALRLLRERLKG